MRKPATKNASRRADWDAYFLEIARVAATRSTCERLHVGAVIVRDRIILSTGYNGSIRGLPHCDQIGHALEHGHCTNTVHAEANAICQAAWTGVSIKDSDIYITYNPCWYCFRLIANAGIRRIVFGDRYGLDLPRVRKYSRLAGIRLVERPFKKQ